jgi:hypothetical protein
MPPFLLNPLPVLDAFRHHRECVTRLQGASHEATGLVRLKQGEDRRYISYTDAWEVPQEEEAAPDAARESNRHCWTHHQCQAHQAVRTVADTRIEATQRLDSERDRLNMRNFPLRSAGLVGLAARGSEPGHLNAADDAL